MNVTLEKSNNVSGVITIVLAEQDYQDKVKKNLKTVGQRHPIKGFRPGHVPEGVLRKYYGKQVLVEVVNDEISETLSNYIHENNLQVLGEPMLTADTKVDFDNDKDFTFKFEVGLCPEFDVKLDKRVKIPYYTIDVDKEMVNNQDTQFRKRFGKQEPGEEFEADALVKGEMVELAEDGSVKEDGLKVENTIVSPQYFRSEDEKAKFNGAKVGAEVVFNPWNTCNGNLSELSSMLNVDKEVADNKSNFKMTVKEIVVNKPAELNQEYFDSVFGKDAVKTEEEYYAKLKENIAAQLVGDSNYRFTLDTEATLMKKVGDLELPDEILKRFFLMKNEDKDAAKMDEEYPKMKPQLQWQLIKDKIAATAEVKVEEDDLKKLAKFVAAQQFAQYGMTNVPDDALENYAKTMLDKQEYRRDFAQRVVDDKIFAYIKENVTVDEKTVSLADFNALFEAKK